MVIQGCGKVYPIFHGSAPSSIKVEKVDLTNAAALAVMPYAAGGSIQTKAGEEEYSNRLYIVDKDGKTTLASFEFKEEGNFNNKFWKKIRETLTLVPEQIIPLKEDLILLSHVGPVYDYTEWRAEVWGYEETHAIEVLLNALTGSYFLRLSDGALFKSPFNLFYARDSYESSSSFDRYLKFTKDQTQMVLCYHQDAAKYDYWKFEPTAVVYEEYTSFDPASNMPWVITDKGNSFELRMPSEQLIDHLFCGFMLTKDNTIVPLTVETKGTWSFDLGLNPLYVDYSKELSEVLTYKFDPYIFEYNGETYVITYGNIGTNDQWKNGLAVYRIYLNNNILDCSLECSEETEYRGGSSRNAITESGLAILTDGRKIVIDLINKDISIEPFPDSFPTNWASYDDNCIAYEMTENAIIKYDLNTKEKTTVPIHWEQVDFGGYVTYSAYYSNGVFSVSGRTRTAQSVTVLIDAETGDVTLTDLSEYSGPVIKSYYRLN